jgi:hypothetical protein
MSIVSKTIRTCCRWQRKGSGPTQCFEHSLNRIQGSSRRKNTSHFVGNVFLSNRNYCRPLVLLCFLGLSRISQQPYSIVCPIITVAELLFYFLFFLKYLALALRIGNVHSQFERKMNNTIDENKKPQII